jgi:hypothetical protein
MTNGRKQSTEQSYKHKTINILEHYLPLNSSFPSMLNSHCLLQECVHCLALQVFRTTDVF